MLQIFLELQIIIMQVITRSVTEPSTFSILPSSDEMREDFPAPTCPTTATSCPGFISIFKLCTKRRNTIKQTLVTLGTVASAYKVTKLLYTYTRAASEICRVLGSTTMKQSAVFFLQYSYTKFLPTVLANISGTMLHTCNMPQMMDT